MKPTLFVCPSEETPADLIALFQQARLICLTRKKMETERRKSERMIPVETTFVAFRPGFEKLGRIKDISMGGLGCEYQIPGPSGKDTEKEAPSEIDLFQSDDRFYLPRVPCSIVYDISLGESASDAPESKTEKRRCGFEFGALTAAVTEKLKAFLQDCTTTSSK